jgi:RimJ/RimL family protein N-acetyltransferase
MIFDLQPTLQNTLVKLIPLKPEHFMELFSVASDPLIWEQHPNSDRYKKEVFEKFFDSAIESKGAFLIIDKTTNGVIGSSRFYEFDAKENSIKIGYTFMARKFWGREYNRAVKNLMINYAFQFIDNVKFQIGATNFRSQKAVEKLGAQKIEEIDMDVNGESIKWSFVYYLSKSNWQ